MRWVSLPNYLKILPMNKLPSFLKQAVHCLSARLFNAPNEVLFEALLKSFHSICLFGSVKSPVLIKVELFGNNEISPTHISIPIEVIGNVRDAFNLSLL